LETQEYTLSTAEQPSAEQTRRICKGWTVLNGIVAKCPEQVTRNRNGSRRYHSVRCGVRTRTMRLAGSVLGGTYVRYRATKHQVLRPCKEWIIRNSIILECGQLFKPQRRHDASSCPKHTPSRHRRKWSGLGYHLDDSIRKTCAYRNCKKGEGGTRKTFDRIHRSPSGGYYCCESHSNLESQAHIREINKEIVARADLILAQQAQQTTNKKVRPLSKETAARITAYACLSIQNVSNWDKGPLMYPKQNIRDNAYKSVVEFAKPRRYKAKTDAERRRIELLSAVERQSELRAALSTIKAAT
jgi:hypothetical protein